MLKKGIVISAVLVGNIYAQMPQKGFFAGVDIHRAEILSSYKTNGALTTAEYDTHTKDRVLGYNLGYQYYFTRVFCTYKSYDYEDLQKRKYKVKSKSYEINAEYIPVIYTNKARDFMLRATFGVMAGYSRSELYDYDVNFLLPVGLVSEKQNKFLYGYGFGILAQSESGLGLEMGYRYRDGNILEFVDENDNAAIFLRTNHEYYLGISYLF